MKRQIDNPQNNITPVTVKGGIFNGNFALQPSFTAATTTLNRWIDGTAIGSTTDSRYGWGVAQTTSGACEASFATIGGRNAIQMVVTGLTKSGSTVGQVQINTLGTYDADPMTTSRQQYLIPVTVGDSIKISSDYYLQSVSDSANTTINIAARFYNSSLGRLSDFGSTSVSGSTLNTWLTTSATSTVPAGAAYVVVKFRVLASGADGTGRNATVACSNISLTQVSTITNSLPVTANYYPKGVAVTSTDNIDQSQVVSDNTNRLGDTGTVKNGQSFIPTKKNLTGFVIRRGNPTGTYTGDVTISIQTDNAGSPSGTDVGTPIVVSNATWNALTSDTDYTVNYPVTLTVGTTYWIVVLSSITDASNYSRLSVQGTGTYANGKLRKFDGASWSDASTNDLYFKTLYSKNTTNITVSTDTETVSVTAPTVDGWANGTVVDTQDIDNFVPLKLKPGTNNIYISSNGHDTVDGKVNPSLRMMLGGVYGRLTNFLNTNALGAGWSKNAPIQKDVYFKRNLDTVKKKKNEVERLKLELLKRII